MPKFEVITFDCYGTLIDWRSGIRAAFEAAGDDGDAALRQYEQVEHEVESEGYRTYREVLNETASRMQSAAKLPESLPSWKPFPDTNRALQRLRAARIRLGILSNVDDDLLAETRKHFTVDFDIIVTAQQVGSYKPAHAHFLEARKRIGNARWLHAAQSNFHDIVPANELGIPSAWINRLGQSPLPGGTPTYEFADLAALARFTTAS